MVDHQEAHLSVARVKAREGYRARLRALRDAGWQPVQ